MTLQGGDREFGHGDEYTVTNAHGSTIEEGQLVYISGYDSVEDRPEVSLADSGSTTGYDAVVKKTEGSGGADNGEKVSVVAHGIVWVRVAAAVSAGETPAASATAGSATNGGSSDDDVYVGPAETKKDGNDYAPAHLK